MALHIRSAGEPVYIPAAGSRDSHACSALAPSFVNPGKDRAIDLCSGGLRWQPGGVTTDAVQARLRRGAFVSLGARRRAPCDEINLLDELEVSARAPDSLDTLELQVDACVRELWRLTHSGSWAFAVFLLSQDPNREPAKRLLQAIALGLSAQAASFKSTTSSQDEITLGRAAAIEEFVTFADRSGLNFHRPDLIIECRQTIERLRRLDVRLTPQARREITAEADPAKASDEMIADGYSAAVTVPSDETMATAAGLTIAPNFAVSSDRHRRIGSMSADVCHSWTELLPSAIGEVDD